MGKWFFSAVLYLAAVTAVASCSSGPVSNGSARSAGGASGSAGAGSSGQTGTAGTGPGIIVPDGGDDGSTCSTTVSCMPLGGQYCGAIGDGCNGTIDCGMNCKADWSCTNSVCIGGANCQAGTCTAGTTNFCGT